VKKLKSIADAIQAIEINYRTGSGSDLAVAKDSNSVLDCPFG
jgi:hypothetical protein